MIHPIQIAVIVALVFMSGLLVGSVVPSVWKRKEGPLRQLLDELKEDNPGCHVTFNIDVQRQKITEVKK